MTLESLAFRQLVDTKTFTLLPYLTNETEFSIGLEPLMKLSNIDMQVDVNDIKMDPELSIQQLQEETKLLFIEEDDPLKGKNVIKVRNMSTESMTVRIVFNPIRYKESFAKKLDKNTFNEHKDDLKELLSDKADLKKVVNIETKFNEKLLDTVMDAVKNSDKSHIKPLVEKAVSEIIETKIDKAIDRETSNLIKISQVKKILDEHTFHAISIGNQRSTKYNIEKMKLLPGEKKCVPLKNIVINDKEYTVKRFLGFSGYYTNKVYGGGQSKNFRVVSEEDLYWNSLKGELVIKNNGRYLKEYNLNLLLEI